MNRSNPSIVVIDDDLSVREGLEGLLRSAGFPVETFASAREFLARPRAEPPLCLVLDVQLPGMSGLDLQQELTRARVAVPIIFLTGRGNIPMSVQAIKAGAVEFFTKPVDPRRLLECIDDVTRRTARAPHTNPPATDFEGVIGNSDALTAVLRQVAQVAPSEATVLIRGETGTGKELIARSIHRRSRRSTGPLLGVNCSAIPQSLITSELFGHEKGAFTGALERRIGRFEQAAGGTLFLDEVGDLPAETQLALLRVLQEREFERIGGSKPIHADVRIVAATNRDLEAAVAAGTFRCDLYYRLNVFPIEMPPLRQRREDIRPLAEYFVDRYARQSGKTMPRISTLTVELLEAYPWPGNIRELQNVLERAVIVCDSDVLSVDKSWLQPFAPCTAPPTMPPGRAWGDCAIIPQPLSPWAANLNLEDLLRATILSALDATRGVVGGPAGAAALLGLKRTTLQARMRKLGLTKTGRALAQARLGDLRTHPPRDSVTLR